MELGQERKDKGGMTLSGDDKEQHKSPDGAGDSDGGDDGTRQPYNCTFCKRGFPTAQALGGHMNVHRKDRGRATPTTTVAATRITSHETLVAFMGYGQATHPASGSEGYSAAGGGCSFHAERAPQELRLFGRDGDRGKEGGAGDRRECLKHGDGDGDGDDEGKVELDLELRLGADACP